MTKGNRFDAPSGLFDLAERSQTIEDSVVLGGLYRRLVNRLHFSDSPNYLPLHWQKITDLIDEWGDKTQMPMALADPNASLLTIPIPRLKERVAIVGSKSTLIDEILEENRQSQAAVGFTYRGDTHIGVLPNGVSDYNYKRSLNMYAAGLRMGRSDMGVGIGAFIPKENAFMVPQNTLVLAKLVLVDSLPIELPDLRFS